jgi:hypothetical protein
MELALAQYLGLRNKAGEVLRFQNYWINQTVDFEIDIEDTIKGAMVCHCAHNRANGSHDAISIKRSNFVHLCGCDHHRLMV